MEDIGMTYLPSGSQRNTIEPGQWFVQTYDVTGGGVWQERRICFHPLDRINAIRFTLEWLYDL